MFSWNLVTEKQLATQEFIKNTLNLTVGLQEAPASMNLKLSIIRDCIIFTSYEDILYKKNQLYSTLKPIY